MKNHWLQIALGSLITVAMAWSAAYAGEAVPQTVKSYEGKTLKLVWNDEFNGTGAPDPADWKYEHGFVRNHEKQFYTEKRAENVYLKDGRLVIVGLREAYEENGVQAEYTSGSVHTKGLHEWQYGRIEVRAKLPKGKGVWPAIWTIGSGAPYPYAGEIDIMEYVGKEPSIVHGTIHGKGKEGRQYCSSHGSVRLPDVEDRMAVYAIEWTHDRIWFFVDDQMYFTVDLNEFNAVGRPFDFPQHLKLNLALGGGWGGPIDDSIFPQTFEIDYVRVYQFD
ncbi:MAG: glycoside hydrolase family 16 protein [Thermoguttaceae bacterium]|nr:glycoside hydrolase family 16 protein [Thermoguttaceae bacterium]